MNYKSKMVPTWDNKRLKCLNCKHIYLKMLSTIPNYCSLDCKTTSQYLEYIDKYFEKNILDILSLE